MLGDHVQADRRLVEEQHVGRVQQRGDQLHLHPLAQRQFADRLPQQLADVEQVGQLVARPLELGRARCGRSADAAETTPAAGRSHQSWFFWPITRAKRRR